MKNFILILLICFCVSCAHVPKSEEVPLDLGYEEIIVLAQRESDANNHRGAKAYYQIMIERFGTDANVLNIGEFEIAHILIKQKKYEQARVLLNQVLARFEGAGSAMLKPEYKKLAEIDLKKIEERTPKKKDDE
ncbi:MAG: hypothetical protein P1P64_03830 [Treponemataceae bacterium]